MSEPILAVHNLTKSYGDYLAVDHISFEIEEGKILGLLGPNGAGKSTTIQMLLGLTEKDAGEICYFGRNFDKQREYCLSRLSFASSYDEMNARLSVFQNLRIYCGLYNVPNPKQRIEELLKLLEVEECADKLFWHLSSGQKTRIILVRALLNKPRMLLMDEPTASLDPDIVNKIIQLIKELQEKEKTTILYTSHNMEEVARLCDQVSFLAKGKIVITDTPTELIKKIGSVSLKIGFEGEQTVIKKFLEEEGYKFHFVTANLVEVDTTETEIPKILFDLKNRQVWIVSIATEKPSLEDVFLHISRNQAL